jgi:PAS domain S-box-containing protein
MSDVKKAEDDNQFPFGELMTSSSIIFYHCSLEEGYPVLAMSSNVEAILGFTEEEFAADRSLWLDRIHEDDRKQVKAAYESITETGEEVVEFRFRHNNGHTIWLRDEIKLVRDDDGNPESLIGSSIEITDQKQAERELQNLNQTLEERIRERTSKLATANRKLKKQIQHRQKAERKLSEQHERMRLLEVAIDNINDMVVVTKAPKEDPTNSEIILVNEAFEKFTGYSTEEVIGLTPTFLHGDETSEKVLQRIDQQIKDHETLREEFINYTKDGTPYWVELDMAPFPSMNNNYEYWVGINRDVTKRKEAEQKLEESEQRYRALAELSFDAIFEIALDGTILNCNKRACDLFGYRRDELIGLNSSQLIPKKYRSEGPDMITDSQTTDEGAWERTYQKKDGTTFPTEIHTQIYEVGGNKRLVAYVRDITAHKEYENRIRKSLKEKETLLAEVHHRVKNNLAVISGLLEMQVLNTEDQQLLNKLKESQSRIQSIAMVHEKLYSSESFSEIQIDNYINDLLDMVVSSIIDDEKQISVRKDMEPVTLAVRQAVPCGLLLNELITNCYKHAFEGRDEGVISISIENPADDLISLRVQDDGVGLPSDFDIDNQSSLGMTLVSTLVRQLDGDLAVNSDEGSSFIISFEIDR